MNQQVIDKLIVCLSGRQNLTDMAEGKINIEVPRYNQSTYWGRATHFAVTTNPLNLFATPAALDRSKDIVTRYRKGEDVGLSENELWKQKQLYDSAFHPDTGEKTIWFGRMSAQVPMSMIITGSMMTFYKTTPQVVFCQWFNQSFNAVVNYSNRSGSVEISKTTLATSYAAATCGALVTALSFNKLVKNMPPLVGRFVPFIAVAAANAVNIPLMRRLELTDGIEMSTEDGIVVGQSTNAAKEGISKVVLSRIAMVTPTMMGIPFIMNHLEKKGTLARYPRMAAPIQIGLCGLILVFSTPLCCAIFEQRASIAVSSCEERIKIAVNALPEPRPTLLYYNKGL